jgi:hypothetical protein
LPDENPVNIAWIYLIVEILIVLNSRCGNDSPDIVYSTGTGPEIKRLK